MDEHIEYGNRIYTDNLQDMMGRSRIHEMVNGPMELKRAETTIREGIFDQYIRNKACAAKALFKPNH